MLDTILIFCLLRLLLYPSMCYILCCILVLLWLLLLFLCREMAAHSSVLAWRIPGTGEPGGLPSMGLLRVGHDWSDLALAFCSSWVQMHEVMRCVSTGSCAVCLCSCVLCVYEVRCYVFIKLHCVLWSCGLWNCVCVCEVVWYVSMKSCIVYLWGYVLCDCEVWFCIFATLATQGYVLLKLGKAVF